MSRLNSAQRTYVLASARHLDDLVVEALRTLQEAGGGSPFTGHVADAEPAQIQALEDSVRRFRDTLLRALADCGIDRPAPQTSALHAARVNLRYAEVALEDFRPGSLHGYGPVAPEVAAKLEDLIAELRVLLRQMTEILAPS